MTRDEMINRANSDLKKDLNVGLVVGGLAGTYYAGRKVPSLITGREKFYHGTKKEYIPNILSEGLKPVSKTNVKSYDTDDYMKQFGEKALNRARKYAYITLNKDEAETYAKQVHFGGYKAVGDLAKTNPYKVIAGAFSNSGKENVITMNIPTWRKDYKTKPDPDTIYSMERNSKSVHVGREMAKQLAKKDIKSTRAISFVSPEFIVESPHYKKTGLSEIYQYAKAKPGRFAAGIGLAAAVPLSLAISGMGVKGYIDESIKERKRRKNEQIKESAFIDELERISK